MADWVSKKVNRVGDMHPERELSIVRAADGDVIISICEHGVIIGGPDYGGTNDPPEASVEFCTSAGGGGRSPHTHRALIALIEAMEKDREERPIG